MQRFINLGIIGEGSYGVVFKCRHKSTGQLVAIKKFIDINCDNLVKKTAAREIRMLQQLQHENLINLLETFVEKRELYLVLQLMDQTLLDLLASSSDGLEEDTCRKCTWQVLKGIQFIHLRNIIHRDLKPENILVSNNGIVKICDFGFARTLTKPGEMYTDYVATRWYRAPELLVGDVKYGRAVDIWAIGCVVAEMLTGEALFPGDSDLDQLCLIMENIGSLTQRHKEVFLRSPFFIGMKLPQAQGFIPIEDIFVKITEDSLSLIKPCLQIDSDKRPTCNDLLKCKLFTKDGFDKTFPLELKEMMQLENKPSLVLKTESPENNANENKITNISRPERRGILKKKKEVERKDNRHHMRSFKEEPRKKCITFKSGRLRKKCHTVKPDCHPMKPECHPSKPEAHTFKPEGHPFKPEGHRSKPECHPSESECHLFNPECYSFKPEGHPFKPEGHRSKQECHLFNPECYSFKPECHPSKPECHPSKLECHPSKPTCTTNCTSSNQTNEIHKDFDCSKVAARTTSHNNSLRLRSLRDNYLQDPRKDPLRCCFSTSKCPVICRTTSSRLQTKTKSAEETSRLPNSSVRYHLHYSAPPLHIKPVKKNLLCRKPMRKIHNCCI